MTDTTPRPTPESSRTPRWRFAAFWVLLAALLFLRFGETPETFLYPVTAFGDVVGENATHEIHIFAVGVLAWVTVAAVLMQLRRPASQVAAAWAITLTAVLPTAPWIMFTDLALTDLPEELTVIVAIVIGIAVLAFFSHPSSLRAKVTPVAQRSVVLFALTALAAIPLFVYAVGQFGIHLDSGPGDEHWAWGHWILMAAFVMLAVVYGLLAAARVSGWRFALWAAGLQVAALGIASLGITAVSQLSTPWAVLAILWGVVFIVVGELEARRDDPRSARQASGRSADTAVAHRVDG